MATKMARSFFQQQGNVRPTKTGMQTSLPLALPLLFFHA
jgi:hypothetical protein